MFIAKIISNSYVMFSSPAEFLRNEFFDYTNLSDDVVRSVLSDCELGFYDGSYTVFTQNGYPLCGKIVDGSTYGATIIICNVFAFKYKPVDIKGVYYKPSELLRLNYWLFNNQ